MTDALDTAAEALRRAGMQVNPRHETAFHVGVRAGRAALISQVRGRKWIDLLQDGCRVAEYSVTEWTPRHTSAVQAWIEEAIVDKDLGGEVEG